jgi:hypothetical protein
VLGVPGADVGLGEVGVQLDLVDGRPDASTIRSICAGVKFDTPIDRTSPSSRRRTNARQVST